MLSIAAPDKFILTLQFVPPFLVEILLTFALAVLLAVPLVVRIQHYFNPSDISETMTISGRRLPYDRRLINQYSSAIAATSESKKTLQLHSVRPLNSSPSLRHNFDSVLTVNADDDDDEEEEAEEVVHNLENDDGATTISTADISISNDRAMYNYDVYRHRIIENNLKKQYGRRQAPGDVVLTCLHLSSIDSTTGVKIRNNYNMKLFDVQSSTHDGDNNNIVEISPRTHFRAKVNDNVKPETTERATTTAESIDEIEQTPIISEKKLLETAIIQRKHKIKRENVNKLSVNIPDTLSSKMAPGDHNLRLKTPTKDIVKTVSRPRTPRSIPRPKLSPKMPKPPPPPSSPLEFIVPVVVKQSLRDASIATNEGECEMLLVKEPTNNDNEATVVNKTSEYYPTARAPVVLEKCSSVATSEAFSTCSSRIPSTRPLSSRPTSSCGTGRHYRNLTSRVNSRPRSSCGSFAWEVPDGIENIYERPMKTRPVTPSVRRPKSASTTISKKKSDGLLSVLESIYDLVYTDSADFMDFNSSTVVNSPFTTEKSNKNHNNDRYIKEKNQSYESTINDKSTRDRNKVQVNSLEFDGRRPFLRSRSGKYATFTVKDKTQK